MYSYRLSLLIIINFYTRNCLACGPFRYVPPRPTTDEVRQEEEPECDDCSRGEARFFLGRRCCVEEEKRPDTRRRLMNATECGRKGGSAPYLHQGDTKIVGGVEALENEFPWQVAIMTENDTWRGCGAILISCDPVVVVSAAHCLTGGLQALPSEIKLSFGAHNMGFGVTSPLDTHEVRLEVEDIIIHPSFQQITVHVGISVRNLDSVNINVWENDIAVIKVKNGSSLPCSKRTIWPACLPHQDYEYGGWNRSVVTGWGLTVDGGIALNVSTVLKKARIPIVSDSQCTQNILQDVPDVSDVELDLVALADTKICAGDILTGQGFCQGDSGGPLVTQDNNDQGWSAVGIVSYLPIPTTNISICGGSRYGVFTEIGKYLDWIANKSDLLPPQLIAE